MLHPQFPDAVVDGHAEKLDIYLLDHRFEAGWLFGKETIEDRIEFRQKVGGLNTQPEGEDGIGFFEMIVVDLEGLLILMQHVVTFAVVEPVDSIEWELIDESGKSFSDELFCFFQ